MGKTVAEPDGEQQELGTRLSRWHPYPAMVADELAVQLAATHVRAGMRVLDPFCGSGRLLFAAARTPDTRCVGFDINPLACLITEAKAAQPDISIVRQLMREAALAPRTGGKQLVLRGSKVAWLSERAAVELGDIVQWVNKAGLSREELLIVAACLSSATREAAWIRRSGWKLHRMAAAKREEHNVSAWAVLSRKLAQYLQEESVLRLAGAVSIRNASAASIDTSSCGQFDLIMTSPPYGDSRTTVQYGAASGICLDVVSQLNGLDDRFMAGGAIDRACLGGPKERSGGNFLLRDYWAGAADSEPARRASMFLQDYKDVLEKCHAALLPQGSIISIVGRRSLGGYRLKLDEFTRDALVDLGYKLETCVKRRLKQKSVPKTINRFGRATDNDRKLAGSTKTIDGEIILTLTKNAEAKTLAA
jgi:site-specific DNA-methyltransferase (cytosine-N4-specific)